MSKPTQAFASAFRRGLASGAYQPIDIIQTIKAVLKADDLRTCLDEYCRQFDPAKPPKKRETFELARTVGFNLFLRAIETSDALNGLLAMVQTLPVLASTEPDAKLESKHHIYAKRYKALSDTDRGTLDQRAKQRAKERAQAAKSLVMTAVEADYLRAKGVAHKTTEDLWAFLATVPENRTEFEAVASRCAKVWTRPLPEERKGLKMASVVEALDEAFDAYDSYLEQRMRTPVDFFRLLSWLREAAPSADEVAVKDGKAYRLGNRSPWRGVWVELYLDTCARAQRLAVTKWNIGTVIHARAFVGADADFLYAPFDARGRKLLRERLSKGFNDVPRFNEFHRARRRCTSIGWLRNIDILDELELDELTSEIAAGWRANPFEVVQRKFTTASLRLAFQSTFHINQTAKDVFTVLWIPKGPSPDHVFIEAHSLPGFCFKAYVRQVGLADMLEDHAYAELKKSAQALAGFMLAYLVVLSLVLDVVTAGAGGGGLRMILLRFAEEKLKEQAVSLGLETAGIDNPWIQTLAGIGTGFIPSALPKAPGIRVPHDLDTPPVPTRGVNRSPTGMPNQAERGLEPPKPPVFFEPPKPPVPPQPPKASVPRARAADASTADAAASDCGSLTEAEEVAVRKQTSVLADRRKQEIVQRQVVAANENVAEAQGALAATMGKRGGGTSGGSSGGTVTTPVSTSGGRPIPAGDPGVLRRPGGPHGASPPRQAKEQPTTSPTQSAA